jgi:hypothetical protein
MNVTINTQQDATNAAQMLADAIQGNKDFQDLANS